MKAFLGLLAAVLLAIGIGVAVEASPPRPRYVGLISTGAGFIKGQLIFDNGFPAVKGIPSTGPQPTDGAVKATNEAGKSFIVIVPPSGNFMLPLPVGSYSLEGSYPRYGLSWILCFGQSKANVANGQTTTENVVCKEQ